MTLPEPVGGGGPDLPLLPSAGSTIPFYETEPDSITWHKIWDHELDNLTNVSRPLVSAGATTLLGAVLGLVPSLAEIYGKVLRGATLGLVDLLVVGLGGACLAAGLVCAAFAIRAQLDAQSVKTKIRARNPRQINRTGVPLTPPK